MKKDFILAMPILMSLLVIGCSTDNPGPEVVGPEPVSTIKFLGRDSISDGNYRGISIHSSPDEAFEILENYRTEKKITYLGAVNNFFSDITDIEKRVHNFEWVVLDEKFDTDSGVQIQLESGVVKSITLNNRKVLTQWPETVNSKEVIRLGDQTELLYNKLLMLSKMTDFSKKFERIVLLDRYTYALYDPEKASLPWTFIYNTEVQGITEQVSIYFKNKKVDYVLVDHFEEK